MVTYFGLYYPYIHFRDEGWLKLTALYWDGMLRIVPTDAALHDTDEVKRLIDAGFIQNKSPVRAAHQIARPFGELINTHGDAMRVRFDVTEREMWPDDEHTRLYAPGRDSKLAYVFDEKISPGLLSDLFAHRLVTSRSDNARWIGMHPKLAKVYMVALAEAMAPRLGAHPLTDAPFDHVAISGLTVERLAAALLDEPDFVAPAPGAAAAEREVEEAMVSLAFKNVVPIEPARIPAKAIIKFRRVYVEERALFQEEIAKLADSLTYLQEVDDPSEVEEHLKNEYNKALAPRIEKLRKDLHSANIDTVESALAVSIAVPAALAAILTAIGLTITSPVGAAAGIAFAAWTIQRKRKKVVKDLLKPSPEAYLYRVSKLSNPQTLASEISASSRAFLAKGH